MSKLGGAALVLVLLGVGAAGGVAVQYRAKSEAARQRFEAATNPVLKRVGEALASGRYEAVYAETSDAFQRAVPQAELVRVLGAYVRNHGRMTSVKDWTYSASGWPRPGDPFEIGGSRTGEPYISLHLDWDGGGTTRIARIKLGRSPEWGPAPPGAMDGEFVEIPAGEKR